jgi:hypothetical protein
MANYLFFFGKSQDFTAYAFDQNDFVADFNSIIKNFDLLESEYFNIDDINNGEIVAKYLFNDENGKQYSLLKIYSFAQALNGNRIAGSSSGVALLSDANLIICPENYNILRVAKDNFSKLCIQNSKFTKSDFLSDVNKIWKALANNEQGNLINAFKTRAFDSKQPNNINLGILINDQKQFLNIPNIDKLDYAKIYFTTDLEHLKRASNRWGEIFKIYTIQQNSISPYKDSVNSNDTGPTPVITSSFNETLPRNEAPNATVDFKITDLKSEIDFLNNLVKSHENTIKKWKMKFKASILLIIILFIAFFIKISSNKTAEKKPSKVKEKVTYVDYKIKSLLSQSDSLRLLNALLDNIILLENSKKQNLNQTNNVILYKSILKQGQALKIDVSFTKAYLPIIVE